MGGFLLNEIDSEEYLGMIGGTDNKISKLQTDLPFRSQSFWLACLLESAVTITCTLIRLFPEKFWFDTALTISALSFTAGLLLTVAGWRWQMALGNER